MTFLRRALWVGCFLFSTGSYAQESAEPPVFEQRTEYPEAVSFFAPFFFPKLLQDEYRLKEYICSEEFAQFRSSHGDVHAVDAIFDRAMKLSWGNVYEALLLCCICTMEHRNFGIRMPVVGPLLWVPLTSEFPGEFRERVHALPTRLYADTPPDSHGDRDKLQHFFGSAFLSYTFESPGVSERIGEFIEWGEDRFVVEGALDERDSRANRQGQRFGLWLLSDDSVRPSRFLRTPVSHRGCAPVDCNDLLSSFVEER